MHTLPYATANHRGETAALMIGVGVAACVVGVVAALWPLRPLLAMRQIPPGTEIRPMNLTALMAVCAGAGLLIALPLAVSCLLLGWRHRVARLLGVLGLLCATVAMFLNFRLFAWIVSTRGLILQD